MLVTNLCLAFLTCGIRVILGQTSPGSQINYSSPCQGDITLFSQADIDAISDCVFFDGNVTTDHSFSGELYLPKLETLFGRLDCANETLFDSTGVMTALILPRLRTLESLTVDSLTKITTIWLPSLSNYTDRIHLLYLPALRNLSSLNLSLPERPDNLSSPASSQQSSLSIVDTNITTLSVLFTGWLKTVFIAENRNLANINMIFDTVDNIEISNIANIRFTSPTARNVVVAGDLVISDCQEYVPSSRHSYQGGNYIVRNCNTTLLDPLPLPASGDLVLMNNPRMASLGTKPSVPDLGRGTRINNKSGNINITNCPSLKRFEVWRGHFLEMEIIGDSLTIAKCASLNRISLPGTTEISGSFTFSDCPLLNNISMPALQIISEDLKITNNSNLKTVSFPSLQSISGSSQIEGNFSDLQFPILERATKGFSINTTDNTFTCSTLDDFYSSHIIRAPYSCSASKSTKNTTAGAQPTSPSEHKSSSFSTAAKVGIGISIGIPLLALFIGTRIVLQKRNKNNEVLSSVSKEAELPQGGHHEIAELELSRPGAELSQGGHHEMTEMAAISGPGELPAHPFEHDSPVIANQEAEYERENGERERDADMRGVR
ncbi:hypothetical protein HYFRA_00010184 [Hymenoscyphus fraxineus]|uniref:Uncharacterized protein n=1 Tax=Hymenoscyphus fraxineus TaxID=746836 RepID=A0A9N9PRT1_9HELO|nr:hypothetical protein HYFRA_00010184 [Hymenoscyphus fraxineus]